MFTYNSIAFKIVSLVIRNLRLSDNHVALVGVKVLYDKIYQEMQNYIAQVVIFAKTFLIFFLQFL